MTSNSYKSALPAGVPRWPGLRPGLVRGGLALLVVLGSLAPLALPVRAQAETPYVFIVPPGFEDEFTNFYHRYGTRLNEDFAFLRTLFGVAPPLPVYIRVYSSRLDLERRNVLVPAVPDDATHTHLGAREIALISPFPPGWFNSDRAYDAVRHELSAVFLSQLSANTIPPALELGVSQYIFGSPGASFINVGYAKLAYRDDTLYSWRALFDGTAALSDPRVAYPQTLAVAAYLLERFGFVSLTNLLGAIGGGQTLADAFIAIYGEPMDRLELDWRAWLPGWLDGGWRSNILYSYDLAPFEAALAQGSYAQVVRGLNSILPFLETTGQTAAQAQAEALLARARQGVAASAQVLAVRAALEAGEYEETLELAGQARTSLAALGDTSREAELAAYEARAQRVLDLRAELAEAERLLATGQVNAAEARLLPLVPAFQEVGDIANAGVAQSLIGAIYGSRLQIAEHRAALARQAVYVFLAVAGVVLLHQAALLVYRRYRPAEEVVL